MMMQHATCRLIESHEDMEKSFNIRRIVFIEGQDVPEEIEMDELDDSALHVLCEVDGQPVATGRLNFFENEIKVGRVAVLKEWRGKGIGTKVVEFLITEARKGSNAVIYANVQTWTESFYARHGFETVSGIFLEADIEHVRMEMKVEK
jgi:predicted GNAT family N-acyltransferase